MSELNDIFIVDHIMAEDGPIRLNKLIKIMMSVEEFNDTFNLNHIRNRCGPIKINK